MSRRTIRDLLKGKEKVYFYLPTDESKKVFAQMAGEEGFVSQSKRNAGLLKSESIMSIHSDDNTVYFCGAQARMIMAAKNVGESILRVDFQKFIDGAESFTYKSVETGDIL